MIVCMWVGGWVRGRGKVVRDGREIGDDAV